MIWPKLRLQATDDIGTSYRIGGGGGIGGNTDFQMEIGMSPAIPESARQLHVTLAEVVWEDINSEAIERAAVGPWTFSVALDRELPARMV